MNQSLTMYKNINAQASGHVQESVIAHIRQPVYEQVQKQVACTLSGHILEGVFYQAAGQIYQVYEHVFQQIQQQ